MKRCLLFAAVVLAAACSSKTTVQQPTGVGPVDPALLGKACSGGCGAGQACAIASAECASGYCGVDYRRGDGDRWLGCTAACDEGSCPSGYECAEVIGDLERGRACLALPAGKLTFSFVAHLDTADGTGSVEWQTSGPLPSDGDAQGCGRAVASEVADATALDVTLCGVFQGVDYVARVRTEIPSGPVQRFVSFDTWVAPRSSYDESNVRFLPGGGGDFKNTSVDADGTIRGSYTATTYDGRPVRGDYVMRLPPR